MTLLTVADLWLTSFVLGGGGSEVNPVIRGLLGAGWSPVLAVKGLSVVAGWTLWLMSEKSALAGAGLRLVTWLLALVVGYEAMGLMWAG